MSEDKKKSDLIPRLITAIVAVPLLLGIILKAPAWAFFLLILVAGAIATWEYCGICYGTQQRPAQALASLCSGGLIAIMYLWPQHLLWGITGSAIALFLLMLFAYKDQAQAAIQLNASAFGVLYGGVMLGCLALMRQVGADGGPYWVIIALAIIWGSDTGAYFAGRAFGKRKLYPAVSPKKSVEGAIGGLISSVLFCFGFNALFHALDPQAWHLLEPWQIFALAIPGNILGQLGDLCESLVKRAHGVKDSGTIIYGHGGMLDRVDALILASPWFYFFVANLSGKSPLG